MNTTDTATARFAQAARIQTLANEYQAAADTATTTAEREHFQRLADRNQTEADRRTRTPQGV